MLSVLWTRCLAACLLAVGLSGIGRVSACRFAICVAACTLLRFVCDMFGVMLGFCLAGSRIAIFVYAFVYTDRLAACFAHMHAYRAAYHMVRCVTVSRSVVSLSIVWA